MTTIELFDATQAAYADVQRLSAQRDAVAVATKDAKDRAEDAYIAACRQADVNLAAAQQAYEAAAATLKGLQAELGKIFSQVMPPVDPRVRTGG